MIHILFDFSKEMAFGTKLNVFLQTRVILNFSCDTMGERIERIRQIRTDFFYFLLKTYALEFKKSVLICLIRSIRSPIVSQLKFMQKLQIA
jgi:hypothetical protein